MTQTKWPCKQWLISKSATFDGNLIEPPFDLVTRQRWNPFTSIFVGKRTQKAKIHGLRFFREGLGIFLLSTAHLVYATKSQKASAENMRVLFTFLWWHSVIMNVINAMLKKSNSLAHAAGISHQSNFCLATPEELQWDISKIRCTFSKMLD